MTKCNCPYSCCNGPAKRVECDNPKRPSVEWIGAMKPKFSLIPADALNVVAGVMTWGNIGSHEEGDWEGLTSEQEHIDKTLRHINNHQRGDVYDESGYHHLAHAAADCLIALSLLIRGQNAGKVDTHNG